MSIDAFGWAYGRTLSCEMVSPTGNNGLGNWANFMTFFGVGVKPELALYTFKESDVKALQAGFCSNDICIHRPVQTEAVK